MIDKKYQTRLASIWRCIDAALRHQLFVVISGIVLSSYVAVHVTGKIDEKRRKEEATIHDRNLLRSAIDDLSSSFELYASASKHAMFALRFHPTDAIRQQTYKDYQAAYSTWIQRRAVDYVAINQRYIGGSQGSIIFNIGDLIQIGTEQLDNCIQGHFLDSVVDVKKSLASIQCHATPPLDSFTVASRRTALRQCVDFLVRDIRPHPISDKEEQRALDALAELSLSHIDDTCSPRLLIGVNVSLKNLPRNLTTDPRLGN
ncbi:hypothetical protein [Burkholderia gladioli]|uniref:hypothetical protein n=1 Tax=Burkholderia gladioli TaxID=28095 RepID=UPI001C22022C|nr:hypothetical protein [Burkholderia gladioli]MBU9175883.1 hypothetical protein [Burkholderia gladioli]